MNSVPKLSFTEAALSLVSLCDYIDRSEDVTPVLINEFNARKSDVTAAVDYQKALHFRISKEIELYKTYRETVTAKIKQLETLRCNIEEATKEVVAANPDIAFRDSLGKKLCVIPNPIPKLVISPEASLGNQFSEYTRQVVRYEPDAVKIKEALLSGVELGWAKIEYGTQLRGLRTTPTSKEVDVV